MPEQSPQEAVQGECRWDCLNMNPTCAFRGWDADQVYKICNRVFAALQRSEVEPPECGIKYAEENTEARFTHA